MSNAAYLSSIIADNLGEIRTENIFDRFFVYTELSSPSAELFFLSSVNLTFSTLEVYRDNYIRKRYCSKSSI
jgi:hypothetical protein